MRRSLVIGALVIISILVFQVRCAVSSDTTRQESCQLNRTVKVAMKYLLYLPNDYQQKPSWPLMLFLHGAGERGDDLTFVKRHGPPKLVESGKQFPFIIVSPQCPSGRWWQAYNDPHLYEWLLEQKRSK
jgi:predicted peptidase